MDSEEGLSHGNDDGGPSQSDCVENDVKEEAKRTCLKIAGQDGYVFKTYSITPQTVDPKPGSRSSNTLAKELSLVSFSTTIPKDITSQVYDQELEPMAKGKQPSTGYSCDEGDSSSSRGSTKTEPSSETETSNMPPQCKNNVHVKEKDKNAMNESIQDDEILAIDNSLGHFANRDNEDYNNFLSGTLYDVAMDAVTQSLLASVRNAVNPRKKSPAWNHFLISPRDGTKAICMYCFKEFSRGKNEKDLSTSCLMRHVRRAHPTVLLQEGEISSGSLNSSVSASLVTPALSPNKRELPSKAAPATQKSTSVSSDSMEVMPKEVLPVTPKLEKHTKNDGTDPSLHSSNIHSEDSVDGLFDSIRGVPKHSNSRRRSAVWKHFYLSPADSSKAVCIHCMNEFSRGKNGKDLGTSCLIRHLWRAHRDVVVDENSRGSNIPPPYTTPPTLLSRFSVQDTTEVKHTPSVSSSPETISDEMPLNFTESMDVKDDFDDVPYQSGQESLNNMSKGDKDLPLSSSPDDTSEDPSLIQNLSSVFQQNKKIMKRVKSEVWHHFIVSPVDQLKALCRYCPCTISRGKRGDFGTSCLMRHLVRRHPNVLKDQNGTASRASPPHSPYATLAAAETLSNVSVEPAEKKPTLPVFTKKTSKLWNHFTICATDPTKVVCLHCNRTISRGKKTTNLGTSCLFRHMQRFHEHVLESNGSISGVVSSATVKVKQELMDTSNEENGGRFDEHHPVAKKITKLVAEMLALDLQPPAVVENLGLNRLLEYLQPQYSLPLSSYFTYTAIPEMYDRVKEVVITHMKEAESEILHFTTSIWVSNQTREYLTLTAHWVSYESCVRPQGEDFHCSALLSVSQTDCDYNVLNIQKQLEYLWDTWISSSGLKIGFVVTDNPSLGNALEDSGHVTVQCFGHALDQIISEALKSQRMVQNLLSIARKICERIHRSAKAKEKLAELQKVHHLPENQLVQDIPSKWKTSLYMLERLIEQKKAIDEMSVECNFRELISCDQWEVVQSVCNTLKPFEVACSEMSNRTATLGQVIPLIHILNRKTDMLFDETMGIDNMLKSLKEAVVSRMSSTLHDARYMWATMLDPRYKTSLFTEEEAEQCKQDLIQELEGLLSTSVETNDSLSNGCNDISASSSNTQSNKDNLWALMDDIRNRIKQEELPKSPERAVMEYLEEEILDQSCDPLDYWNLKKVLWPDLAKVAVRYVGCPPSIVTAESLLSTASVNFAVNQSRPSLEDLEKLMFLKVNLPLIYFQY